MVWLLLGNLLRPSSWHTATPKVSSEFIWSHTRQYSSQCEMSRLSNTSPSGQRAAVNQNYTALDVSIRPIKFPFMHSDPVDGVMSLLTTASCMCVCVNVLHMCVCIYVKLQAVVR